MKSDKKLSKFQMLNHTLRLLEEAFETADPPFRVDVLDWHAVSDSFRRVIEQNYLVL